MSMEVANVSIFLTDPSKVRASAENIGRHVSRESNRREVGVNPRRLGPQTETETALNVSGGGGGLPSARYHHHHWHINLLGGGAKRPLSGYSYATTKRHIRLSAHTWWIFLNIYCAHSEKKCRSGSSGHQSRFVDSTTEKFATVLELEFSTGQFSMFRLD